MGTAVIDNTITVEERAFMKKEFLDCNKDHPGWNDNPKFEEFILPFIKEMGFCSPEAIKVSNSEYSKHLRAEQIETGSEKFNKMIELAKIPGQYLTGYNHDFYPEGNGFVDDYFKKHNVDKVYPDIFIYGKSYFGKSRMAAEILKSFLRLGFVGFFINIPKLREMRFESMSVDEVQKRKASHYLSNATELAKKVPVLVVDDIGKNPEKNGNGIDLSFISNMIYNIYNDRINKNKITITTSELSLSSDKMKQRLTESTVNRMGARAYRFNFTPEMRFTDWKQKEQQGELV